MQQGFQFFAERFLSQNRNNLGAARLSVDPKVVISWRRNDDLVSGFEKSPGQIFEGIVATVERLNAVQREIGVARECLSQIMRFDIRVPMERVRFDKLNECLNDFGRWFHCGFVAVEF